MSRSRAVIVFLLPLAATVGCQAINDLIPTHPSGSPSPSATTVLTIPVILPTPKPTPPPTPGPTPAPSPDPTAPPSGSCSLPPSTGNYTCGDDAAQFYPDVDAALTRVTKAHPEYFDLNDKTCENCYYVKNVNGYLAAVQNQLKAAGYCSHYDGEELAVKNVNRFNEQYDILLGNNHMRRGPGSYRGACHPANF